MGIHSKGYAFSHTHQVSPPAEKRHKHLSTILEASSDTFNRASDTNYEHGVSDTSSRSEDGSDASSPNCSTDGADMPYSDSDMDSFSDDQNSNGDDNIISNLEESIWYENSEDEPSEDEEDEHNEEADDSNNSDVNSEEAENESEHCSSSANSYESHNGVSDVSNSASESGGYDTSDIDGILASMPPVCERIGASDRLADRNGCRNPLDEETVTHHASPRGLEVGTDSDHGDAANMTGCLETSPVACVRRHSPDNCDGYETDDMFKDTVIKPAASSEVLFDVDSFWNSINSTQPNDVTNPATAVSNTHVENAEAEHGTGSIEDLMVQTVDEPEVCVKVSVSDNTNLNKSEMYVSAHSSAYPSRYSTPIATRPGHADEMSHSVVSNITAPDALSCTPIPAGAHISNTVVTGCTPKLNSERLRCTSAPNPDAVDASLQDSPVQEAVDEDSPKRRALTRSVSGCGQVFSDGMCVLVKESENIPEGFLKRKCPNVREKPQKGLSRGSFLRKKSASTLQKFRQNLGSNNLQRQASYASACHNVKAGIPTSSPLECQRKVGSPRLQSASTIESVGTSVSSFNDTNSTAFNDSESYDISTSEDQCGGSLNSPAPKRLPHRNQSSANSISDRKEIQTREIHSNMSTPSKQVGRTSAVHRLMVHSPMHKLLISGGRIQGSSSSETDVSGVDSNLSVTEAPSPRRTSLADKKEAKRQRKRARVIEELLHTENTYQHHLELVVKCFEEPLRESKLLPDIVIVTIFSNVRQIISINRELMEHLQNLSIGEAFLKLGPFLKLYSTYAKNHERALAVMMEWDQKCPEYSAFRRSQEDSEYMNGLKLNALLITPVQRIPRYKLLLEELLENTLPDHKDYGAIKEAVSQVAAVANHINDHIKQQDNFMKMLAIQKSLTGTSTPKLLIPGRMFVKEGTLKKVSKSGGRSYERKFFLFSDILMYAKPKLLESGLHHSYVCCCILPLQHCQVTRVFGHSQGQGALFNVKCKDESLLLFSEQKIVNSWIIALDKAISEFNNNRQTLRKVSSAKQPLRKAAIAKLLKHEKELDPLTAAVRRTPDRPSPRSLKRAFHDSDRKTPSPLRTSNKVKATNNSGLVTPGKEQDKKDSSEKSSLKEALSCLSPCGFSKRWRDSKRPYVKRKDNMDVSAETKPEPVGGPVAANECENIQPQGLKISTPIRHMEGQFGTSTPQSCLTSPPQSVNMSGHYQDVWKLPNESCLSITTCSPVFSANQPITDPRPALGHAHRRPRPFSEDTFSASPAPTRGRPMGFDGCAKHNSSVNTPAINRSLPAFTLPETPGTNTCPPKIRKNRPVSIESDSLSLSENDKATPSTRPSTRLKTAMRAAASFSKSYTGTPAVNYGAACSLQ